LLNRSFGEAIPLRDGREVGEWLGAVARVVHAENLRMAPTFLDIVRRRDELSWVARYDTRPGKPRRVSSI
jgi:hypothetical protein